jgi:hypothetical protein
MGYRRVAVIALCVVVVCGVAIIWRSSREKARLVETAIQYRARAEHGDAETQYRTGSIYYYGRGVPQDYVEALRWYRRAADQGMAVAQYAVSYCLSHGRGLPEDRAEAVQWLRKAAEQGFPLAQSTLAELYYRGRDVPEDDAEAVRWARKAADQGDATGQFYLGRAYCWGQGVSKDRAAAARWYRKAADQGDEAARFYLAGAYRRGDGVPRNRIEAVRWYLKFFGPVSLRSMRRTGWMPEIALVLMVAALVKGKRPSLRAPWLASALLSGGGAAFAIHLAAGSTCWTPVGRLAVAAFFTTMSIAYAAVAVKEWRDSRSNQAPA